jgi:hypothetical protein
MIGLGMMVGQYDVMVTAVHILRSAIDILIFRLT